MSEDKTIQETGQEVTPNNSKENETTYTAQEMASFIAESKKYRQRAQASETKLAKLEKNNEIQKLKDMETQEKYQELANEYKSKYEKAQAFETKYNDMESMMRSDYLKKLPENMRENYGSTDLKTLQNIVNDFNVSKPAPVNNSNAGRFGGYDNADDLAVNNPEGYKEFKKKNSIFNVFTPSDK